MAKNENDERILRLQMALPKLRQAARWTADDLAQRLRLSKQTISNIETGKAKLTFIQYIAIRSAFDAELVSSNNPELARCFDKYLNIGKDEINYKELVDQINQNSGEQISNLEVLDRFPTIASISSIWIPMVISEEEKSNKNDTKKESWGTGLEKIVTSLVGLGVPGLLFLVAISTSGYVGAAAITTALAAIGGPMGMIGGIVALGLVSTVTSSLSEYGFDLLFTAVVNGLYKKGESKEMIIEKIEKYPVSKELKLKLFEYLKKLS